MGRPRGFRKVFDGFRTENRPNGPLFPQKHGGSSGFRISKWLVSLPVDLDRTDQQLPGITGGDSADLELRSAL